MTQVDQYTFTADRGQWIADDWIIPADATIFDWWIEDAWSRVVASNLVRFADHR